MSAYLRPPAVIAFAAGVTLGSLTIAAAATFGAGAAQELPSCQSVTYAHSAVVE